MELKLLENGLDILKSGMVFYKRFLDMNDSNEFDLQDYLRLSIFSLHGAVEILMKKVLADINDILIYRDISKNLLEQLKLHQENQNSGMPLHYYLISSPSGGEVINYQETIERFCTVYPISEPIRYYLQELDRYKNKVTYFGFSSGVDFYNTISTFNCILSFLKNDVLIKLKTCEQGLAESNLRLISQTIDEGLPAENEVWDVFIKRKSLYVEQILSEVCASFREIISHQELIWEPYAADETGTRQNEYLISYKQKSDGKLIKQIKSMIIPKLNSRIFYGNLPYGTINFIIDYSTGENVLYVFDSPSLMPDFSTVYHRFWEKEISCRKQELNSQNLLQLFTKLVSNKETNSYLFASI